jgi:hypothetical protein
MELEFERVESFMVKGIRFTCISKWNGLEEWKGDKGRKMIVERGYEGGFAASFQQLFGDSPLAKHEPGKIRVIGASPDLVAQLKG